MAEQKLNPLFCVDVTENKDSEVLTGAEFISHSASKEKLEQYELKQAEILKTIDKANTPIWLQIIKYLLGVYAIAIILAGIKSGFGLAFTNSPILMISGFVSGVVWIVLQIALKRKEKKMLNNSNAEQQLGEINQIIDSIFEDYGISQDAVEMDVLSFRYTVKNGEIKPYTSGLQLTPYYNGVVKVFATEDELHIAEIQNAYSFKKSEITGIKTVDKWIAVPTWNKPEDVKDEKFSKYKLTINGAGLLSVKSYHIIEINHEDKLYGIYFPCYEREVIENLTGLKVEE